MASSLKLVNPLEGNDPKGASRGRGPNQNGSSERTASAPQGRRTSIRRPWHITRGRIFRHRGNALQVLQVLQVSQVFAGFAGSARFDTFVGAASIADLGHSNNVHHAAASHVCGC